MFRLVTFCSGVMVILFLPRYKVGQGYPSQRCKFQSSMVAVARSRKLTFSARVEEICRFKSCYFSDESTASTAVSFSFKLIFFVCSYFVFHTRVVFLSGTKSQADCSSNWEKKNKTGSFHTTPDLFVLLRFRRPGPGYTWHLFCRLDW